MPMFRAKGKITLGKRSVKKSRKNRPALRKTRKAIKQYVNKAISRKIETKLCNKVFNQTILGYIDGTNVIDLIPTITQGTGEANRVGNKVNCSKLTIRGNIYCFNQATTVPPVWFDMYIFKAKSRVPTPPTTTEMVQFLEDGNSSKQYVGNVLDGMRYLNNDLFTIVKHKRYLMYNPLNTSNYLSSTSQVNPCRTFSMSLGKSVKNSWLFNDSSSSVFNDNLYFAIACTLSNGSVLPVNTAFGSLDMIVQTSYKDA